MLIIGLFALVSLAVSPVARAVEPPTGPLTKQSCAEYLEHPAWWAPNAVDDAVLIIKWISVLEVGQLRALTAAESKDDVLVILFSATGHQIPPPTSFAHRMGFGPRRDDELAYLRMALENKQFYRRQLKNATSLNLVKAVQALGSRAKESASPFVAFYASETTLIRYDLSDALAEYFKTHVASLLEALRTPSIFALVYEFLLENRAKLDSRHFRVMKNYAENVDHGTISATSRELLDVDSKEILEKIEAFRVKMNDRRANDWWSSRTPAQIEQMLPPPGAKALRKPPPPAWNAQVEPTPSAPQITYSFEPAEVEGFITSRPTSPITSVTDPALANLSEGLREVARLVNAGLFAVHSDLNPRPPWGQWRQTCLTRPGDIYHVETALHECHKIKTRALDRIDDVTLGFKALDRWLDQQDESIAGLDRTKTALEALSPRQRYTFDSVLKALPQLHKLIEISVRSLEGRQTVETEHLAALTQLANLIGHHLNADIDPGVEGAVAQRLLTEALDHLSVLESGSKP